MGTSLSTSNIGNSQIKNQHFGCNSPKNLIFPIKLELALERKSLSLHDQINNSWSLTDKSNYIIVKEENPQVACRHPISKSTDSIRGRKSYDAGFHVWEINWPLEHRGSNAVIGVATSRAPLHSNKYEPLLGSNSQSWGWDIGRCRLYHNTINMDANIIYYPYFLDDASSKLYTVPNRFLLLLDMDEGTVAFMVNDQYLGVAFHGLKNLILYPSISMVWGNAEVTLTYKGSIQAQPFKLMELSRHVIRINLVECSISNIVKLPLPESLKQYLAMNKLLPDTSVCKLFNFKY